MSGRFSTAAHHYLAGRPDYSPRLVRRVVQLCGLTQNHRVLDLGCGPGLLAVAFAQFAREVVGMDPEPEMLRVATAREAAPNITWTQAASHDLGEQFGKFQLVTMGRSFHWMDRADTLRRLDALIEPAGAIALFDDTYPRIPENAWRAAWRNVIENYSGDDAPSRYSRSPDWLRHEAILLDSGFPELEEIAVIERRRVTVDMLVERALSMSSTSRARIGDRADDMVRDVREALARVAPDDGLTEVISTSALIARRN